MPQSAGQVALREFDVAQLAELVRRQNAGSVSPWHSAVGDTLGTLVGESAGDVVGSEVVGEIVGAVVAGAAVGETVGSEVVGDMLGEVVGSEAVGDSDGEVVGSEVVGDVLGEMVGAEVVGERDGDSVSGQLLQRAGQVTEMPSGMQSSTPKLRHRSGSSSSWHVRVGETVGSLVVGASVGIELVGEVLTRHVPHAIAHCIRSAASVSASHSDVSMNAQYALSRRPLQSTVGDTVGERVGSEEVGEMLGAAVGSEVVGESDGDAVGSEVVGAIDGETVGSDVVGRKVGVRVGDTVGTAVVGDAVGERVGEAEVGDPVGESVVGHVLQRMGHVSPSSNAVHWFLLNRAHTAPSGTP